MNYQRPAQEIEVRDFCGRDELNITQRDHTANWETLNGLGWWHGRFRVERNGALSVDITEQGKKSAKRVMVELSPDAVFALFNLLNRQMAKEAA